MGLIKYSNGKDIRTVSMHVHDWERLYEAANLNGGEQDGRILDTLRNAITNGHTPRWRLRRPKASKDDGPSQ
jgi:hypothetical protein